MIKKFFVLSVLMLALLVFGCQADNSKNASGWAQYYAILEFEEDDGRESLVQVEEYVLRFEDGEVGIDEWSDSEKGTVSKIFKISFIIVDKIKMGGEETKAYFVKLTWESTSYSGFFGEDKIASVEINKAKEIK